MTKCGKQLHSYFLCPFVSQIEILGLDKDERVYNRHFVSDQMFALLPFGTRYSQRRSFLACHKDGLYNLDWCLLWNCYLWTTYFWHILLMSL